MNISRVIYLCSLFTKIESRDHVAVKIFQRNYVISNQLQNVNKPVAQAAVQLHDKNSNF